MKHAVLSVVAPVVVGLAATAAGGLAAVAAWGWVARALAIGADGDEINLVMFMFDWRSIAAGAVAGILAAVVVGGVLSSLFLRLARRLPPL